MSDDASRYEDRPFLRLLECYALKAIGGLSAEEDANLTAMEPTLTKIYLFDGTWVEIVEAAMEFPPHLPGVIKEAWQKNLELAKSKGEEYPPQQFAEMFADETSQE